MAEGQLWSDEIEYIQAQSVWEASEKLEPLNHNLTAVHVESIEKSLCFCPRIKFKSEFLVYNSPRDIIKKKKFLTSVTSSAENRKMAFDF